MQKLYEKLKLFYLGMDENSTPIVYENKDLTTHGLIIGMTGSGKTGLGIGLIEEATLDNIPSIIIDPKGDMGNLLLTFPKMDAKSLEPWVDENEASNKGLSKLQYAENVASMWKKGIESSDQDIDRVQRLKDAGEFTIYTPGSSSGAGVALISTFKAPPKEILEDNDILTTLISSTVTSILSLVDVESDPISGKEHILISSILMNSFEKGEDLDFQALISLIVTPPFEKVGVFPLDTFYPQDKRFELAMKLNAVMASPSFSAWLKGDALDMDKMLFTKEGKAKVNIFSIGHLNDKERMFFVTLLLNSFLGWMRRQEGSSRLKALLYMDEIFGFFPPNQNPPSKQPMMTLLKQARAFGIGIVLSTQNPVDLDYKGLSNIGTWFIGRLQTTQDKERVISGLSGIKGSKFSKKELMELLSNIKKRHFLLKNIHEEGLRVFSTRWVLSYLKGPLSRDQISFLMKDKKSDATSVSTTKQKSKKNVKTSTAPILSVDIEQRYSYYSQSEEYILAPFLACEATVNFVDKKKEIETKKEICIKIPLSNADEINWEEKEDIEQTELMKKPKIGSSYGKLPSFLEEEKNLKGYEKEFKNYLYQNERVSIFANKKLKIFSNIGESQEAFMIKVNDSLETLCEEAVEKLKESFVKKQDALEKKLQTASLKLDKEESDVSSKTTNAVINIGSSILGALLGGSLFSRTNASKLGSSVKSASGILKEKRDVQRAKEKIESIDEEIKELQDTLNAKLDETKEEFSIKNYPVSTFEISPRRADIYDTKLFILWEEE